MALEGGSTADPALLEIIQANTVLVPVPLVPEIRIYQSAEPIGLWRTPSLPPGNAAWIRPSGPSPGPAAER